MSTNKGVSYAENSALQKRRYDIFYVTLSEPGAVQPWRVLFLQCRVLLSHSFGGAVPSETYVRFTSTEINEIINKEMELIPDIDEERLAYINSFAKESTSKIHEALNTQHSKLASETGHEWKEESDTKLLKEETLKDIFIELSRKVDFYEDKIRKINAPGFIHSGIYDTDYNIYMFCDSDLLNTNILQPCEVYADVKNFYKTLDVLVSIIYAKLEIFEIMKIIDLQCWKNKRKVKKVDISISECHPSPKKKKTQAVVIFFCLNLYKTIKQQLENQYKS
ncbi:2013_t:CDS:2 [Funneliformis geosporum]|uniref:8615_t:CDS:1 n=1 Tax=Funneliformis geosporum TaxID=1117311 RepID=A0A9W4SA14_9GLOM|nr:2013_t:CDS:2 [Funneliformis geosporum]CAI2161694.1 8615_t:CDS:2 [Funneliformis geosporum]